MVFKPWLDFVTKKQMSVYKERIWVVLGLDLLFG
jgi:hypothetical protein